LPRPNPILLTQLQVKTTDIARRGHSPILVEAAECVFTQQLFQRRILFRCNLILHLRRICFSAAEVEAMIATTRLTCFASVSSMELNLPWQKLL
jgi:hypothetical protein